MNNTDKDKMSYEDLDTAVSVVLTDANKKVEDLIEKFNEQNEGEMEVDTVDLDSKFEPLHDYLQDYINE
jgi:hypothetical protein